jgi:hypothetical protein
VAGAPLDVDDGNLCTDDSCDPATGAVFANNTASCEDGDTCTVDDICGGGVCLAGVFSCELFACGDSMDNDGDDLIDYPSDLECQSPDTDSEIGTPLSPTIDFTQMGDFTTPVLYMSGVTVWADAPGGASPSIVISQSVDEFGGVGASGGADPVCVDEDESISFDFSPGSVVGLSYRMHQIAPLDPAQPFSPYILRVWDPDQNVTFSDTIQQVGTVDVSSLIGGSVIGGFEIGATWQYPIQISQLSYSVPPSCSDGYDNDGDDLVDFPADPQCTSPSANSEAGAPLPATHDFTQTGGGVFPDLDFGTVLVDGTDSAGSPAALVLNDASDEFGGLGVQGGAESDFVDQGERLSFDFGPGRASNVAYRMHQVSSALPAKLFTSYVVTVWDADGITLFSQSIHQIGTVNVSALVGNQAIGGFEIESQPGGNAIRISQINYDFETKLVDTLQLLSIGSQDGRTRESKEDSDQGGYANSTQTTASAIRAGDQRKDKQHRGLVSFDTSMLPPGVEITRATVDLTLGKMNGSPLSTLGNLLADVKTGSFGLSALVEKADFQAAATASGAAVLLVDSGSAIGELNASGVAAINRNGITQLRLRFEVDDDDDGDGDYLGFYSGSHSNSSLHPMLEIEYEYWTP